MQKSAVDRFRTELRHWISAHNEVKGFQTNADDTFSALEARIGTESLAQIGSAFINGWLATEAEASRGYFVREADRPGTRGGQFVMINRGGGKADPCWELFVQLADYSWLRAVAQRHGQTVRLEDRLMDLTVRTEHELVLYVEHKTTRALAERLLDAMRHYGKIGFNINDDDKGNDPLRKAKYLVRDPASRPLYFGVSAVAFKKLFRVEYGDGNRFHLVEDQRSFSAPLIDRPGGGRSVSVWSPVDTLAIEIHRLCPRVWISVGSGRTAYNFYAGASEGDAIIIGIQKPNEVWTDVARLGKERTERLSSALAKSGIALDSNKSWTFWRAGESKLDLNRVDPTEIAEAVRHALDLPGAARQVQLPLVMSAEILADLPDE